MITNITALVTIFLVTNTTVSVHQDGTRKSVVTSVIEREISIHYRDGIEICRTNDTILTDTSEHFYAKAECKTNWVKIKMTFNPSPPLP